MWRMQQEIRKKAGLQPEPEPKPVADPKAKTDSSQKPQGSPTEDGSPSPDPSSPPAPDAAPDAEGDKAKADEAPVDPKKMSPWKLVDQFKKRATEAEARALELEKRVLPEGKQKELTETLQRYESRVKEMEEELRYFNAEKYDPDILKANQEYESAWTRASKELSEITLTDPNTQAVRAVTNADLLELVNLPLGKAREIADQYFGVFADDVMAHRKEIRNLFEAKHSKLEELKKNGSERDGKRKAEYEQVMGQVQAQVKEIYEKANAEAAKDEKMGKYFSEREGDEEWNGRLKKGYELVDRAYQENSMDPRLTPDQRSAIVRRHAAVRNRAASWGPLRWHNEQLQARITEMEKELGQYKQSTPAAGGSAENGSPAAPLKGMDRLFGEIQKIAR